MIYPDLSNEISYEDRLQLDQSEHYIQERRQNGQPGRLYLDTPENELEIASIIAASGIVGMPWPQPDGLDTCFVATRHDSSYATGQINLIKGRPENQTLAIGYCSDAVGIYADIENCLPLANAARRLRKTPREILDECYRHSVGILLMSKGELTEAVTMKTERGTTVLLMGITEGDGHYFYNGVRDQLFQRFRAHIAGSSLNTNQEPVYPVSKQEEAFKRFKYLLDAFVIVEEVTHQGEATEAKSSTLLDLTGEEVKILREGSVNMVELSKIFPELSNNVTFGI